MATTFEYSDRARQFASFDALTGFYEALAAKETVKVDRPELSEDRKEELDRIIRDMKPMDMVTAVYYRDGEYLQTTGVVSKIDYYDRSITIVKNRIAIKDIFALYEA